VLTTIYALSCKIHSRIVDHCGPDTLPVLKHRMTIPLDTPQVISEWDWPLHHHHDIYIRYLKPNSV